MGAFAGNRYPVLIVVLIMICVYQQLEMQNMRASISTQATVRSDTAESVSSPVERPVAAESARCPTVEDKAPVSSSNDEFPPIDFYQHPGRTFLQVAASLQSVPPTDKVSRHAYEVIYEKYLGPLRHKKDIKLLEIGIGCGMHNGPGRGFELFTTYMPHVKYHAIDYGNCGDVLRSIGGLSVAEARRRNVAVISKEGIDYLLDHMVWGSQDNKAVTDEAIRRWGPFDVIIDDGSHFPALTLAAFRNTFHEGLKPGGAYIIEDLAVSFRSDWGGTREQQLSHETVPGFFGDLMIYLHYEYWHPDHQNRLHMPNVREHLDIVEWTRTIECDREICALVKRLERAPGAQTLRQNVLPKF